MAHNLIPVVLDMTLRQALDKAYGFQAPVGMTLVGISAQVGALVGTPTNVQFDLMGGPAGTTELIANVFTITAAGHATWLTPHFGGNQTPIVVAKGDQITIDVKFTAGSTPSVTGTVTLWLLVGTV